MADDWTHGGFGLYVHWPYCQSKCPYCNFNSHVAQQIDEKAFVRAYVSEIDRLSSLVPDRILNTIFFGGGTPSLMDPDTVAAVIDAARAAWPTANDMEVTLEANPGSVEAGRFRAYRAAGINRLSMGVQALNDTDLRRLGRLHDVNSAMRAFDIARDTFDRVSFDLIYARQHQSLSDWEVELRLALSMAVDHLSLYQLTIEDGTAFGDRYKRDKLPGLPNDDLSADMYDLTQDLCGAAGMPAYEVSNHAAPGAESRHNLIYWRYGDYAGVGPGAHGRLTRNGVRVATESHRNPALWLNAVERTGSGDSLTSALSGTEQAEEYLMMCLRLREGASMARYERLSGATLDRGALSRLQELGMTTLENDCLKVTDQGRPVLNAVLRDILTG